MRRTREPFISDGSSRDDSVGASMRFQRFRCYAADMEFEA